MPTWHPPGMSPVPDAAAPAGWSRVGRGLLVPVARTVAWAGAPGTGRTRRWWAAWRFPAALGEVLLTRRARFARDGGAVTVLLLRPVPRRQEVLTLLVGWVVAGAFATGLRAVGGWQLLVGVYVVLAYVVSASVLRALRDRSDRSAAERAGRLRLPGLERRGWHLGRVVARDPGRPDLPAAVAALLDAVLPPGVEVIALARSDREQADLEAAGFTEPWGDHGTMLRTVRSPAAPTPEPPERPAGGLSRG